MFRHYIKGSNTENYEPNFGFPVFTTEPDSFGGEFGVLTLISS